MKPQDLYRGQAPAAMGMMGQGLLETGANIGRTIQSGYQAMGQGIASGIERGVTAVSDAYKEKKKLEAQNKADEGFYNSMLPYFDEATRNNLAARHEDLISDPSASALDKAAFYHTAKSYLAQAVQARESVAKIKQYEAEAAYKNAVATMKTTVPDPYAAFGGIEKPAPMGSVMPPPSAQNNLPLPQEDSTDSITGTPSLISAASPLDWNSLSQQSKDSINKNFGGKKGWDSLAPDRKRYILLGGQ